MKEAIKNENLEETEIKSTLRMAPLKIGDPNQSMEMDSTEEYGLHVVKDPKCTYCKEDTSAGSLIIEEKHICGHCLLKAFDSILKRKENGSKLNA